MAEKQEQSFRWIPVEERLPELGDVVVALSERNELRFAFRFPVTGDWAFSTSEMPIVPRYWVPLPEAPKEDQNNE